MDRTKVCSCLSLIVLLTSFIAGCSGSHSLTVGSKNFTEQVILGEILAQHLERGLHLKVNRKLNLGGTLLAHQALLDRDLDMYPEYTGTAFTNVLKQEPISDSSVVLDRVRTQYLNAMQLQWMDPLGFNNSFAIGVSGADARAHHLTTLTDAADYAPGFALGAGYEFMQRPDGYGTLNAAYPIHWTASPKTMDLGLLYTALQQKQVSMIAGSTTDAMLVVQDVKVLKDNKNAFPPYQACVVVRSSTLTATPGLKESLSQLSGKISDDVMRKMNYEVDGKHRQVADVAKDFLDSWK